MLQIAISLLGILFLGLAGLAVLFLDRLRTKWPLYLGAPGRGRHR